MSREYAEDKIKEILSQTKGNQSKAVQRVIAESMQDARLLQGLSAPHLKGIVAHAVSRVVRRQETEFEEEIVPEMPITLDMAPNTFGKEILTALSGTGRTFGDEVYIPPTRTATPQKKKASQAHIDAILKMAGKKQPDS